MPRNQHEFFKFNSYHNEKVFHSVDVEQILEVSNIFSNRYLINCNFEQRLWEIIGPIFMSRDSLKICYPTGSK